MITETQIARVANDWNRHANETLEVELIGGALYGFGSEVATLRLLKQYRNVKTANCGFSENLNKFYFVLEGNF